MKFAKILIMISPVILGAGCAYDGGRAGYGTYGYSSTAPHGAEVLASEANRADRALEAALRDQLSRYGDLAALSPNVRISAHDGVVTLAGTVPGDREREMIEACARNTSGVASVNDQLQVAYPPTGAVGQREQVYSSSQPVSLPPVPETLTLEVQAATEADRILGQRIIDGVRSDSILPTFAPFVNVRVTQGRVLLEGSVPSGKERRAIEDAVKRVPGVVSVRNELKVP